MTDAWDDHYATEAGARYYPNEELVRWISGRRFDAVLDVGAGTGSNTMLLQDHVKRVVALEPNGKAQRILQERFFGGVRSSLELMPPDIVGGSAGDTGFEDGTFDLLIDSMTSQHIPWAEHEAVYREYRRVLRPGGFLWLFHLDRETSCGNRLVPDTDAMDCSWLSLFPTMDMICLPDGTALVRCVEAAGFEGEERCGLKREYPNGDIASYTIVVARKA